MALATFDQIHDFLELKKSMSEDYPTLTILLSTLQTVFEKYCSREFDLKERTKIFKVSDPDGETSFWLKGTPIVSVTSITVTDTEGDDTLLDLNDDYYSYDERVEFLSAAVRGSTVTIVYVGGLVNQTDDTSFLNTIPTDLNLAMIQQVSYQYQNRSRLAATSVSLDTNSTKTPGLILLPYTTQVLDDYKNWGTGF